MKKRKIKININNALCVVHLSTAISWRGGEQQLVYLYEELEKSNIEQFIVCSKHSAIESYCIKHQLSFISIKKLTGFDIFFAKKLNNFCKSINAGIIHTHDSHAHTIALLSHVIFKNNAPVIVSRRVDFPLHSKLSSWKYNHPIVKQILCVSGKIKEVMNPFIKDKSKLEVVYSGIDLERFCSRKKENILKSQYHLSENTILIGNASALADHKDYFTFIDVAEKMEKKNSNLMFLIIGDGHEKQNLYDYVKERHINNIIFCGFKDNIHIILPELDIFLITSKTEGLGTSVLDAFACRVPVVATSAGGIPEIVEHLKTGLLAPVKDVSGIVDCINNLLNSTKLKETLIDNAFERVKQFSTKQMAEKTLFFYQTNLNK